MTAGGRGMTHDLPIHCTLNTAIAYITKGWKPVHRPFREKKPVDDNWQNRRIDLSNVHQYFNSERQNIGVQLGPASNNLLDLDLDCAESLVIAPFFVPKTSAIFGRKTKRFSHRLYYTDLADTIDKARLEFTDPCAKGGDKAMLLEVRIGGGGKGAQTIFPGSVHKDTGEAIGLEDGHNGEPAPVEGNVLLRTVKITATACLIARYWPAIGARHDTGLAVGGFLARCGLGGPTIALF